MHSETEQFGVVTEFARRRAPRHVATVTTVIVLAMVAGGCAASRAFRNGNGAARAGEWDVAVDQYRQALEKDPKNAEYRVALQRAMGSASLDFVEKGRVAEARGQLTDALQDYRRASEFDPTNATLAATVTEL
jgi:general secretion pathway protein D